MQRETPPTQQQQQQDTALLQQLQLKNLQEQLQVQLDLNKHQQIEYDKLKATLERLDPSDIAKLKSTVNELLEVQRDKQLEAVKESEHIRRERELYEQLQRLYAFYGLPPNAVAFRGPQKEQKSVERLSDIQFLSQIDRVLQPQQTSFPPQQSEQQSVHSQQQSVESQYVQPQSVSVEPKTVKSESIETPNEPKQSVPTEHSEQSIASEQRTSEQHEQAATEQSTPEQSTPEQSSIPESTSSVPPLTLIVRDEDLPDMATVLPFEPRFANESYGVSYVSDRLDDYVAELCTPHVTLSSDIAFTFCVPLDWHGLTAIVITDPFTAERGIFADKISISSPIQSNAPPTGTDDDDFALPKFVGFNEMLVDQKYATIVVSFNADTFVPNIPNFTTEIMGAYAAFIDYKGEPTVTIVTGVGWGGVLAVQLLERHGGCRLHGGLVLDSPVGNVRWQSDYYGDLLTLFEWVSPKAYQTITNTDSNAISHLLLESWEEFGRPYIFQALSAPNTTTGEDENPRDSKTKEMLKTLGIRCTYKLDSEINDTATQHCLYNEVTSAIRKAALYLVSFRLAFGGQDPFDNYRTLYLSDVFPQLNEQISRKMADETPLNYQTRFLETSGILKTPLSILTTRRDPEIPEWQTVEYLRKHRQIKGGGGLGGHLINDTISHFFGHAHVDPLGKELVEHLNILTAMISTSRKIQDTTLNQRLWVGQLEMVDPKLAVCPFEGRWYREMADAVKSSLKSGALKSNNKIQELLDGETPPVLPLSNKETQPTPTPAPAPVAVTNAVQIDQLSLSRDVLSAVKPQRRMIMQ
eukprot:c9858_g1_i3.p1 GENE.c9858_g1_i3~~c9858_g1_i3.p1  ORF type:complete len:807 (-),score=237.11 c9858_g1_i3:32-2452(-)